MQDRLGDASANASGRWAALSQSAFGRRECAADSPQDDRRPLPLYHARAAQFDIAGKSLQ
jgi:hypothetical protein